MGIPEETSPFESHTLESAFEEKPTRVRVLLPDTMREGERYPVLYILPVDFGERHHWGDGLEEARRVNAANRYGMICVAPSFTRWPWYGNHWRKRGVKQESHFLRCVVPFIESHYPTIAAPEGRLLIGFSKSGWGAFSLLLRHLDAFGCAAAWDAPLAMRMPGKYGSGEVFGAWWNFHRYRVRTLLEKRRRRLRKEPARLVVGGWGNFLEHVVFADRYMDLLRIPHVCVNENERAHEWHSGWFEEMLEPLVGCHEEWVAARGTSADFGCDGSGS